ncbi:hypothetical protein ES705_16863 [subsurface metagenome]
MTKNEPKKCANCGAERHPGSTLCHDCIIACGRSVPLPRADEETIMEIFRGSRKIAELDITGWSARAIAHQIDIQIHLQNRNIKISAMKSSK